MASKRMTEFCYKQVIVFRSDLRLTKGKMAAQAGHAAVSAAEEARKSFRNWWKAWIKEGQCKIVVKVAGENEMLELKRQAEESSMPCALITDRGLTEIPPGTKTCLGIGPAPNEKVDEVTSRLPLL